MNSSKVNHLNSIISSFSSNDLGKDGTDSPFGLQMKLICNKKLSALFISKILIIFSTLISRFISSVVSLVMASTEFLSFSGLKVPFITFQK